MMLPKLKKFDVTVEVTLTDPAFQDGLTTKEMFDKVKKDWSFGEHPEATYILRSVGTPKAIKNPKRSV